MNTVPDAKNLSNRQASLAAVLTCVAGYIDAIGYLLLGQVYVANMSGNSVSLGINSARMNWPQIWKYGWAIASYIVGLLISRFLVTGMKRNGREVGPAVAFTVQAL